MNNLQIEFELPGGCDNVIVAHDLLRIPIKAIRHITEPLMTATKAANKIFNEEPS